MTKYTSRDEEKLMAELWDPALADDLLRFVMYVYPWGKKGTPLEHHAGPRAWQRDELNEMTEHIRAQKERMKLGFKPEMWRKATASGRGPGKSALVAWISHWMLTTRLGSTVVITANTETQLKTKTFAEIKKWLTLAVNGHWFDTGAMVIRPAKWFEAQLKAELKIDTGYYYCEGQLWSEENPDAFAGAHNHYGIMYAFDEASGIPVSIFDITEGCFTEPVLYRFWNVYSNPRRNAGGFYNCFHNPDTKQMWRLRQIDSRTVDGLDTQLFDGMIRQHGIDDDVVRVEVLGQFPKQGSKQFISNLLVWDAQRREISEDQFAPLIMGVDPARFGDDPTVLRFRRGRDARSIPPIRFRNRDNMFVANRIAEAIDKYRPDAVNIDAGNGTGVIDKLREMRYRVHEVWFGSTKGISPEWANKRTEMYAELRAWLVGGVIDDDPKLFTDLTTPEYGYFGKAGDKIMLQSKEEIKPKIKRSTDDGDALALTFARRVSRLDSHTGLRSMHSRTRIIRDIDYPIFGRYITQVWKKWRHCLDLLIQVSVTGHSVHAAGDTGARPSGGSGA